MDTRMYNVYNAIKVLDHGFIRVVDLMGGDAAVVQAARVSYGAGTKSVNEDEGLIDYLMANRHTTPFEMCEIKFHVKLPIFVARQWIRHRTANVNEYSARYSVMSKEFYIPGPEDVKAQSGTNKQGRDGELKDGAVSNFLYMLGNDCIDSYDSYEGALNDGVARELARIGLPLNIYTEWYWKIDLHNLLHFCSLRADPHAQPEIRAYADVIVDILREWVPMTMKAWDYHVYNGTRVSQGGIEVLRRLIGGEHVTQETSGLKKREWDKIRTTFLDAAKV